MVSKRKNNKLGGPATFTEGNEMCLLPVQFTALTHLLRIFPAYRFIGLNMYVLQVVMEIWKKGFIKDWRLIRDYPIIQMFNTNIPFDLFNKCWFFPCKNISRNWQYRLRRWRQGTAALLKKGLGTNQRPLVQCTDVGHWCKQKIRYLPYPPLLTRIGWQQRFWDLGWF